MLLDSIYSPADVKKLNRAELHQLVDEIRSALITKVSATGGHMGSNLGMVEMTVALHYVFDSPKDKIVFDVSHQSYTHKILTGRKEGFMDPSKYKSLSGFTTPAESEHDMFKIGHTSTGVSLASGLAVGRDLCGGDENIIAIVGDGSLTGGEAFEGLEFVGVMKSNFIIIANDNEMSIAPNQGGLNENLRQLRETNGECKDNYFKSLGLDYRFLGDGNNLDALIDLFESVKGIDHPIVLHIHTLKGKGLEWCEKDKERSHWTMPVGFDPSKYPPSYQRIAGDHLLKKMKEDSKVIAISAGTPSVLGFTAEKRAEAGSQFIDVGIAEEHAIALASGVARRGGKPVTAIFGSFLQRTFDQLTQDLAMNMSPATILVMGAGIEGGDCTHNGMFDIAMTTAIPNLVLLAPSDKERYLAAIDWSLEQTEHPVVIFDPDVYRECGEDIRYDDIPGPRIVKEGKKVAIIALGGFLGLGEEVVDRLQEHGIDPTLIDPMRFDVIDEQFYDALLRDHKVIVTLENGVVMGGFGEKIARHYGTSDVKVLCFGAEKDFHDLMSTKDVLELNHLTPPQIVEDILKLL